MNKKIYNILGDGINIFKKPIPLICINNEDVEKAITIDKKYEALAIDDTNQYSLKNNYNNHHWFKKERFSEDINYDRKINKNNKGI